MRLIDADAFWNRLQQVVYDIFTYPADGEQYAHVGYYTETIQEVLKQTKTIEAPSVDAVEVIRCKDCKHRRFGEFGARRCAVWQTYNGFGDDGFCHYGERRE